MRGNPLEQAKRAFRFAKGPLAVRYGAGPLTRLLIKTCLNAGTILAIKTRGQERHAISDPDTSV